jgi:RNA polymerase sigma factor (sigma-70 family)
MDAVRRGAAGQPLRRLLSDGATGALSDAELLERFLSGREEAAEAAFEALVSRHGSMVSDVCYRLLDNAYDVEDACQSVFLILAVKAGSVRRRESIASWLYGVALRVARHARSQSARRRAGERRVAARTSQGGKWTPPEDRERVDILFQEIERLPRNYREPVVSRYLEGLTLEMAARQLSCPIGTLGVRLFRARERLKRRLSRRGVTVLAALVVAGLSGRSTAAALPEDLVRSIVRTAVQFNSSGTIALVATELAKNVLKRMVWVKCARAGSAGLIVTVVAACSGLMLARAVLSTDDGPNAPQAVLSSISPQAAGTVSPSPVSAASRGGLGQAGAESVTQTHLPQHPKVLWKFPTFGDPGTVLLADGVVYFGDRYENLYAVRLSDRAFLWRARGLGHVYLPPAKHRDTVYVASPTGISALSAEDGKVLWNAKLGGNATGATPLIVNDRVIVADDSGVVYALELNGQRIWEHDMMDDEESRRERDFRIQIRAQLKRGPGAAEPRPPASDGTTIFLPLFDKSHRLLAIDVDKGFRRWTFRAAGMIYGKPSLAEDKVFFGCFDGDDLKTMTGRFYGLNKRRGILWEFPTPVRIDAGSAYHDGSIYFGSSGGRFYRINAETGKEIWSYQIPDVHETEAAIYCTPLCTADSVYFNSFDGHLYSLKIANGELKWRFEPSAGSEVDLSLATDGQRIVVGVRRNSRTKTGEDAIIAIGEDENSGAQRPDARN